MDTPSYQPIKTYLKSVEFESPNTPELFFYAENDANLEISIDVHLKVSDDSYYLVELHTSLTPKINEQVVFGLKLTYSSLIELLDKDMDEEQRKFLLTVVIPQSMYNPLRALVWDLTSMSGFPPIMMSDHNFNATRTNTVLEPVINNPTLQEIGPGTNAYSDGAPKNIFPLSWDWILEDVRLIADGEGIAFLESVKQSTGHDLLIYEESPLFMYYYRFLTPIEYNHPEYEGCDDSYWPLLFQLLFAEGENVKVIAGDNGLPEVEFDFGIEGRRRVSSLSIDELKFITDELSSNAFTCTLVEILRLEMHMNHDYARRLRDDRLILMEEFHALFNTDQVDASAEDVAIVEKLYARIKDCDLQTFPYKF